MLPGSLSNPHILGTYTKGHDPLSTSVPLSSSLAGSPSSTFLMVAILPLLQLPLTSEVPTLGPCPFACLGLSTLDFRSFQALSLVSLLPFRFPLYIWASRCFVALARSQRCTRV